MYALLLPKFTELYKTINNRPITDFKFTFCSIILAIFLASFGWQITKVVIFFLPLVTSTIACSIPNFLFLISERKMSKEVTLLEAERAQLPLIQICKEANSSVYDGQMEAGCFLEKFERDQSTEDCGVDGEGNGIIFAGRVEVQNGQGFFDEDLASLKVDCLAAGLWNNYFEGCSKWSYSSNENLEEIDHLNLI